ncbi:uncharacterized protein (TIGR02679 family) [Murinocardiopsis flavida]|uniref:Uncharacterized protein (TIGR02679 family) n=1 Tax=Murinocardiopsis flavida TaxID=645275 RepID=A0A2P8DEU4_9ACTN|nr:TIGR02679 family protein [Murinocardiopsis flavida]PSK95746.1 uncharacterized protein (TIGR02679 family) [Murinocardiopsis flavida]
MGLSGGGHPVDLERLRRLLGTPETAWLVDRARRRLANDRALTGTVSRTPASPEERAAIGRLLGRAPRPGRSLNVSLDAVDAALRHSEVSPDGLAAAVEALRGPVRSRAAADAAAAREWEAACAPLARVCAARPALARWYERAGATGALRRAVPQDAAAAPLLRAAAKILAELPADGLALSAFSARVAGDAHALDDGRPLASLVFGAVRALTGAAEGSGAQWRRDVWAAAGLVRDELSSTVPALGLPGDDHTVTGRVLRELREAGEPAVLTLRQLVGAPPAPLPAGTVVRVCENPTVLSAAAERLGPACSPLVCVQGQPGAGALALLRLCAASGARLHYHGDFDWGGLRIATAVGRHVDWDPWRYTAADYTAAAAYGGTALSGTPADADWDAGLRPAMERAGVRVEEETVLDLLLDDLAR